MPAVHHLSQLGVPLYITETGVADTGDERRPIMIETYMAQVLLLCCDCAVHELCITCAPLRPALGLRSHL